MTAIARSIAGEPVTTKLAMRMEDSLQAFAIRAACFIGELEVPFSEEFDGHDFGATHVIAYVGEEPVGAVRVRWFQSFAMPERLAVIQRYRGHNVGQLLLERVRALALSRGCNMLYAQVLPGARRHQVLGEAGMAPADPGGGRQRTQAHHRHGARGGSQQAIARRRGAGSDRSASRATTRFDRRAEGHSIELALTRGLERLRGVWTQLMQLRCTLNADVAHERR
jgi:GNAT superfamily N-acetyltransferase